MEKQRLNSYWPSDDNDDTDEELQKEVKVVKTS